MKARVLAAAMALPLVLGCGGKDGPRSPFGCTLDVAGAVSEELWCIVAAYDYTELPLPQDEWGFLLVAYRGTLEAPEVAGEVGMFLGGRPALGTAYGWDGAARTALLTDGAADRYDGDGFPTHSAWSIDETGMLSVEFSAIPRPGATDGELIGVHGTLSGVLPSETGGAPVTVSATF
jgi:hypothetical protein